MQTIIDDRRSIYIHQNATADELPLTRFVEIPSVSNSNPFVPDHMEEPKIYMGDVLVGVTNERIVFAELVVEKVDNGVLTVPLNVGSPRVVPDNIFSSRIFKADEIHIYEGVGSPVGDVDVEFDHSAINKPEQTRPR